jgi:hypothetical protein
MSPTLVELEPLKDVTLPNGIVYPLSKLDFAAPFAFSNAFWYANKSRIVRLPAADARIIIPAHGDVSGALITDSSTERDFKLSWWYVAPPAPRPRAGDAKWIVLSNLHSRSGALLVGVGWCTDSRIYGLRRQPAWVYDLLTMLGLGDYVSDMDARVTEADRTLHKFRGRYYP